MYQTPGLVKAFEAAAAYGKNLCVKMGTDGRITTCGADDSSFLGVTAEDNSGGSSPYTQNVILSGIAQVTSDGAGAVDEQNLLVPAASGKVKTRTLASGANRRVVLGEAISAAAATDGLLVDVHLAPFHALLT